MSLRYAIPTLLLAGCAQPRDDFSQPVAPPTTPVATGCEGLEVLETVHFGGSYDALAHDGEVLYAATAERIDVIAEQGAAASDHISVPGETHHILVLGDELWVASGTAGITRIREPRDPEQRQTTHWPWPGDVRSLAASGGMVWAADWSGRVLAIPQDASEGDAPSSVIVDGWPGDLVPRGDGVLVSTREPGFILVEMLGGRLEVTRPEQDVTWAGAFCSEGEDVWVNTHDDLVHLRGFQRFAAAATSPLVRVVPWHGGYVLAASRRKGVLQWDGASVDSYAWGMHIPGTTEEAPAHDILPIDDTVVAVAAGRAGLLWAQDEQTGWSLAAFSPSMGEWEAVVPLEQGLAAALTTAGGASVVLLLELDEHGSLVERDRIPVPTQVTDMLQVGEELLVSTMDIFAIDLTQPPGQREALRLGLVPEAVHGLELLPSGRVAGLIRGRALVWFERGGSGWSLVGETSIGKTFTPMALASYGETVGITYAGHGRLRLFEQPGEPSWGEHVMAGQVATSDDGIMRLTGDTLLEERLWFALPRIGVESLIPGDHAHQRILFQPGAWDVKAWDGHLAVALDQQGVGLLDPARPEEPWLARCDLPGITRKLVPLDDKLIAFGGGTATVLGRR